MFNYRKLTMSVILLVAMWLLFAIALPVAASGPFVETNVKTVQSFEGENIGDGFGWVGANIGDIDDDGINDLIVTAPFYGADQSTAGRAYVYSGCDQTLLHTATGNAGDTLGYSVASAGDVNQDGTLDYILGGPFGSRAVVYSGQDHSTLLELSGEGDDNFGASVAGVGDVNGDGYADLIIGATNAAQPGATITNTGRIYMISGQDGSTLWTRDGVEQDALLGGGLGVVGDLNSDNVPDVVVSARGAGPNGQGQAYLLSGVDGEIIYTLEPTGPAGTPPTYGRFFTSGAGDVNLDGTPDIFVGDYNAARDEANSTGRAYIYSGVDGSPLHVLEAETDGDGLGPGRGIPDVNGDGHADIIVGAWTSSAGSPVGGKIYLYSGRDKALLGTVTGTLENDSLGVDALSLGDISGDGLPDFLITAVGNDFNGEDVGRAYIVSFDAPFTAE